MRLRYTFCDNSTALFVTCLAVVLAAFFLLVGLGPDRLPFPPEAEFSDAVISHWPNALFWRRAVLHDHTWPLWRPLLMSGQPFAANPLNKVWYPPQWLVLLIPPALHLNVLLWLHLTLAGAGAWTWARRTGLLTWPAALVGLGYAFAPRVIASAGAGHLDLVYAAAWFPWLLWAVDRVIKPAEKRAAWCWLGIIAALCFLADVRLSLYAYATTSAYLLWRWVTTSDPGWRAAMRRSGPRFVAAGLLAAGLTAVQWVPFLLMRADLSRSTITLKEAAANSLTPGQWLGLLIGDHGGSWETLVYVGVSTLVLALVALWRRPRALALWGVLLLCVMAYAMGDHFIVWTALNRLIPPLRWWRVPPRVWLIAALIFPYLAGWGAQLLATQPPDRRVARLSVVALLGGGMVCGVFSTLTLSNQLEWTATVGTFALPGVALVMLLAMSGKVSRRGLMVLFTLVVVADVLWIDRTLIEGRHKREWLEPYHALADYLDDAGAVRVYSPSYSLPQQAAAYWSIAQFGGVDPFQQAAYVRAAEAATGVEAGGYSITIPAYESENGDEDEQQSAADVLAIANQDAMIQPDLLGRWLVTHVVSAFPIEADGLVLDTQIDDAYIYRNAHAPNVTLQWDGPNRVTVHAAQPYQGTLYAVATGRWKDVDRDHDLPGLPGEVGQPAQTWTFEYDQSEVRLSALVAGVLIALAGVMWWAVIRD